MLRNKMKKLLAIILIFTLTYTNFALVTEAYASTFTEAILGIKQDDADKNVLFDAYLETEDIKDTSVISDVNNEDLAIGIDLDIENNGYLKDAKIKVLCTEDEERVNFNFKEIEETPEYVESIVDDTLILQRLDNSLDQIALRIPIEFNNEKFFNEKDLSKDFLVVLEGIYVTSEDEEEVRREIKLNLSWKNERDLSVKSNIEKYIDFGKGVIIQSKVLVDNQTVLNTIRVKETNLKIAVPKYQDVYPSNVSVVANSTMATNGKSVGEINPDDIAWYYDSTNGELTINVENKEQEVVVNEFENEFLQDQEKELIKENRLYNLSGIDEYVITYTYNDISSSDEVVNIESNIEASQTILGSIENNVITSNYTYEEELVEKVGKIVSIDVYNKTEDISKAYFYADIKGSKYDIDIDSVATISVLYGDIVNSIEIEDTGSNYIVGENEKIFANPDAIYREISVSRDSFVKMLGEDGKIEVYDVSDLTNPIASIIAAETSDEILSVNFDGEHSKIVIRTSKPVVEDSSRNEVKSLSLNINKVIRNVSVDKDTIKEVESVSTNLSMKANYDYVDNNVDVGNVETKALLSNTKTNAVLSLEGRESLSTLAVNENVLLRIALNNATVESDLYGHSEFVIEMPEDVEEISNISANMVLENEVLEISSIEAEGKTIKIVVDGDQKEVRTGGIENGTIIDVRADIKVNPFTPIKFDTIKLNYTNNDATIYENDGTSEVEINYSAPMGVVVANSTYNYNENAGRLTSVNQGNVVDLINVYSPEKTATMELVVMNNDSNNLSDISILGRFPYKGVKSILTNEELGTTVDTVVGNLRPNNNNVDFDIYYSNNENATGDINLEENGWSKEISEDSKSYLIVPTDANYIMESGSILRFEYDYTIPANLKHNESIYGTFVVYYTSILETTANREEIEPDLVGITTGEGPELNIKTSVNKTEVREHEEVMVDIEISNVGEYKAEDVIAEMVVPKNSSYLSYRNENEKIHISEEDNVVKANIDVLECNEKMVFSIALEASEVKNAIDQVLEKYDINSLNSGEVIITEEELNHREDTYIEPKVTVTAKDLGITLESQTEKVKVLGAELEVKLLNRSVLDGGPEIHKAGEQFRFFIDVTNLSDDRINNLTITQELPKEYKFIKGTLCEYIDGNLEEKEIAEYDNNKVVWKINSIDRSGFVTVRLYVEVNELDSGITKKIVYSSVKVSGDGTDEYESNSEAVEIGKPQLHIVQTSSNVGDYVKEGDKLTYSFEITNEGGARADEVELTDVIPDGVKAVKLSYNADGVQSSKSISSNKDAILTVGVEPGEEIEVNVDTVVATLNGAQEKTITNYANVSYEGTDNYKTNEVTHIVEPLVENNLVANTIERTSSGRIKTAESSEGNAISKTYKITGQAWLDENRDGMRNDGEKELSGLTARLVNNDTGYIVKSVTTDSTGAYSFVGVENGNYMVLFDYDTVKYSVTAYQKDSIASNVNSDFVTTKVEQDGKTRNAAVSNVIKVLNGSISGIDIGLVLADVFDLRVDKTITKVTVQTAASGTNTESYDHTKFTKTEIAAKQLVGSTVYVEYEIKVTNVGDIAGYAKKIVDYIPSGMTFSSTLGNNSIWYTSTDGKLLTEELANKQLAKGESATVKLVLTRQMTMENTDIVSNLAEIYEDYNIYGVSDVNSTPGNKAQNENDLSNADIAIMVKTGETFINISIIAMTVLLLIIVAFVVHNKVSEIIRRKGGV